MLYTIREIIRRRMQEVGLRGVSLCRDLHFNPANFSSFLVGRRDLGTDKLIKVLDYLGLVLVRKVDEPKENHLELRDMIKSTIKGRQGRVYQVAQECGIVSTSFSSFLSGQRSLKCDSIDIVIEYLDLTLKPLKGFEFHSQAEIDIENEKKARREQRKRERLNGEVQQ